MSPSPLVVVSSRGSEADGKSSPTPIDLGARVRELRTERGWSLDETSTRTGLSRSSLFKIEKGQMSPTFDALQKLARGLELEVPQLLVAQSEKGAEGRRCITRKGESARYETDNYVQVPLAADLARKSFLPFELVLRARSLDDFDDWDRHDTEDFMYVLSGTMILYTEHYEPLTLREGDSVYYDSRMGHACVSGGDKDSVVLWISSG
ncbi:MAG: helix-turn-helix domain-containing protein [Gammaproteobacteria bacterium]